MDVDLIFKIAAVGILVAVLNLLLVRSGREEQAMMTTLAGLVVVLMMLVQQISDLFQLVKTLFGLSEMEAVWQIVALGLLGAVLAALLKKHTPELALLLAVAVCGAAALAAVRGVREVWAFLEDLLAAVEISSTLFLPLLKTAGIAVVTRIGADLCRDAGESAVASAVEMAGAMGALLAVLPLMQAAWEVLRSLL